MSNIQCYSCKGFGHIATNCTKKFCNYCKKSGHIIRDCPIRPPKKSETTFNAIVGSSNKTNLGQSSITIEMIQQMIYQMSSNLFFKVVESYHNILVQLHNKMVWLKERIVISLMSFEPFLLSLVFHLIFCVKLCLLLSI